MTENGVTCPYSEPKCDAQIAENARRCHCGRVVKQCGDCRAQNRAFANFCRSCGKSLPASRSNWTGYRGGPARLGLNGASVGTDSTTKKLPLTLRLGNECRSILGYDGHLIAVSLHGVVEIADVLAAGSFCRFQVQGPVTAQPCIRNGVLYLGAGRQLSAYSLAAMTMRPPRVRPLWTVPLSGTPIHALTAIEDRLYVTVASPDWREIHVIDNVDRPAAPRLLHGATKTSWVAADSHSAKAVFLSESDGRGIQLHVAGPELITHAVSLRQLSEHPIALIGGTIFGVFGDAQRLYRIDASTGAVEESLEEDTQLFALSQDADEEWDRELVHIDSSGIVFSRLGVRDSFEPHDRAVKGSPLIVRNCAAVVGMEDGRVRIYNLSQLPRHELWIVDSNTAPITALASFDSYVAAGNREGVVEVREIRAAGPRS